MGFDTFRLATAMAFAAVVSAACGAGEKNPKPDAFFEPELMPFYYSFLLDAARYGRDVAQGDDTIVLRYAPLGDGLAGRCDTLTHRDVGAFGRGARRLDGWREVTISQSMPRSDGRFKALLYHELGHCLLGLNHDLSSENAIMYPFLPRFPLEVEANWEAAVRHMMEVPPDDSAGGESGPAAGAVAFATERTPGESGGVLACKALPLAR